jgi:hypothetical protein
VIETCGAVSVGTNRRCRHGERMVEARFMTSVAVAGSNMATKTRRRLVSAAIEPSGLQRVQSGRNQAQNRRGGTLANNFVTFQPSSIDSLSQKYLRLLPVLDLDLPRFHGQFRDS